ESHQVARLELPHLPDFRFDDGCWTNESAETGPIRPKNHRHVAGEVHRANRVSIVVDIRRMQPGLSSVFPCPARLRNDQPHARAIGVVVYFPRRREKHLNVFRREEIRRTVRPVQYSDVPLTAVLRNRTVRNLAQPTWRCVGIAAMQHVSSSQNAPLPAELSQDEGGPAAEIQRRVDSARNRKIRSSARILSAPQFK